jgi:hypothetical protein
MRNEGYYGEYEIVWHAAMGLSFRSQSPGLVFSNDLSPGEPCPLPTPHAKDARGWGFPQG